MLEAGISTVDINGRRQIIDKNTGLMSCYEREVIDASIIVDTIFHK